MGLARRQGWFRPGDDQPVAVDAFLTDVTESKNLAEEQLDLERQMQHTQKLESLGVLAGGIAHDFNNIMMVILGNADIAIQGLSPYAPARNHMVEIEKAARRATGLAKQMLACSGRGKFVVRPIQLNEFVSEMIHMLEVIIFKKAVLKFNYADNLPVFKGDETLIRQIIMNLITNASEPIGDRSGVIAISTGAMVCNRDYLSAANLPTTAGLPDPLPEGVYVFFKVADTGCGMTVEVQQKLFDPLFTTKFTGRGLGMAAVQGIVRGQKGAIKVYSEIGKGSTFKVLFPVAEEAWQVEILGDHPDTTSQWSGDGAILVADDEEAVCAVSKFMRERVGFDVITAPDGRAALDLFKANVGKVACVLLDLTMPHMNGDEVFREMRLLQPDIKVNISSGYNKHDATQHFTGKGLAGFIQKPYFSTALISKLREVLQNPIGN